MTAAGARTADLARTAIGLLIARGETVAVAESLTGGLVAAALSSVPGASAALRGGVVAYAADLKAALLGVPADLLERHGTVHAAVAEAMAAGARDRLGATAAVATTGVAGPDPSEGKPVGMVFIAVARPAGTISRRLALTGDRAAIRAATVDSALDLLIAATREEAD
jgi:nicotinamide-nucleotide amidase